MLVGREAAVDVRGVRTALGKEEDARAADGVSRALGAVKGDLVGCRDAAGVRPVMLVVPLSVAVEVDSPEVS
jgi:hypothetical protein